MYGSMYATNGGSLQILVGVEALDTKPVSTNNFVTIDKDAEAKPPELKRRTREWVHPAQNHNVDHLAFVGQ